MSAIQQLEARLREVLPNAEIKTDYQEDLSRVQNLDVIYAGRHISVEWWQHKFSVAVNAIWYGMNADVTTSSEDAAFDFIMRVAMTEEEYRKYSKYDELFAYQEERPQ